MTQRYAALAVLTSVVLASACQTVSDTETTVSRCNAEAPTGSRISRCNDDPNVDVITREDLRRSGGFPERGARHPNN